MPKEITVSWEVWADGEKRFQAFLKNNAKEPYYVTIEGNQVQLIDWKDSQNRVIKFKQDNKNVNPKTVRLTIPSNAPKPDPNKADPNKPDPNKPDPNKPDPNKPDPVKPDPGKYGIITPPIENRGVKTDGYYYCSCGEKGWGYGRWKVSFVNRCAHADDPSHKYKSAELEWSKKKDVDPKEGQWTCKGCDADYCAMCGKEKLKSRQHRLTKVNEVKMPTK